MILSHKKSITKTVTIIKKLIDSDQILVTKNISYCQ